MAPRRLFLSEEEGSGSLVPKPKRSRPWNLCYSEVNGCRFMESQLESMVRAVVRDEVQKLFLNYVHPPPRPSISQIQEAVRFQLYFQTGLPRTLFTGKGIKSEDKMRIKIAIKDANNRAVTYGPMSTLKIKIVVIKSDFNSDGKASWSKEEFIDHIILARCGKRPLLTGELEVRMQAGVACIVDASFTDISKWTRSGKFRLGAIVSDGRYSGERVQEAISEAFKVKDGRLESSQKDCPPSLDDEVCRLKKIQKGGAFHEKLKANRIVTVQDFLRAKVMDANELRTLLGKGMSNKWWEATLEHASQCDLGNRRYFYHVAGEGIELVFNSIFELTGARTYGQYQAVGDLSPSLQGKVNHYKKIAYMNRGDIFELHDSRLERALHVMDAPLVPGSNSYNLYDSHHNAMFHEFEHQAKASCQELASEIPQPGSHPLHRPASFKKAASFRSSSGKYQHHFVPGPSTSHHDETTKLSCGIFSDDQGFICYRRYQGSQSYSRTDSLDEWMALIQSPPPSSSRKWVQLSAAFKLMFVKQSAGRRARIARPRHQAMAARA